MSVRDDITQRIVDRLVLVYTSTTHTHTHTHTFSWADESTCKHKNNLVAARAILLQGQVLIT